MQTTNKLGNELPHFSGINPENIIDDLDTILCSNRQEIEALLQGTYDWASFIEPLTTLAVKLSNFWSPINHLHSVAETPELRKAHQTCVTKLSEYGTWLGLHTGVYNAYQHIANSKEFLSFNIAQKKVIHNALRDFHLAGVALPDDKKARFMEIRKKLSQCQTNFANNVLDATDSWQYLVSNREELHGIPDYAIQMFKEKAIAADKDGWLIGIDYPSYHAVITYAKQQQLRQKVYEAYATRASDVGPNAGRWNNEELMQEILTLRKEMVELLGFDTYTQYSIATKMAETTDEVFDFLYELAAKAHDGAAREYQELQDFASQQGCQRQLQPWDIAFYSEQLKQSKFSFSTEQLRPYFPANKVIHGLFTIVQKLYGLRIEEHPGIDVWHQDVTFYVIFDSDNNMRGKFYLDLYARPHKRGGAWMDECKCRRKNIDASIQHPIAYITCNFTPPASGKEALLDHNEVTTLFHEFGHGLQHMLTIIDYPDVSGINGVPWDAVELPSQFMEQWCWQEESLAIISSHHETGESLPTELLAKAIAAKQFQAGMFLTRQLELGLFDFRLHHEFSLGDTQQEIQEILNDVRNKISVVPTATYNRLQHSFNHIFAGGYAAGYYSYLWAEVLASDAFAEFSKQGIFAAKLGNLFLTTFLEQGGSKEPIDLFFEFCARQPSTEALLKDYGLQ